MQLSSACSLSNGSNMCISLYSFARVPYTCKKILHIHYLTYKTTASSTGNVAKNKYMHTVLNITR